MSFAAVASFAGPLVGSLISGSSSGGPGPLASLLGGAATAQRIPGQTSPGEFNPGDNSVGATYNYIPSGAGQIDPRILQLLMGASGNTQGVQSGNPSQMGGLDAQSFAALQNIMQNPGIAQLLSGAGTVSNANTWAAPLANNIGQNAFSNAGYLDSTVRAMQGGWGDYKSDLDANLYTANAQAGAGAVGSAYSGAGTDIAGHGSQLTGLYDQLIGNRLANPFQAQTIGGAQQAGGMLQQAGQNAYGQGGAVAGTAGQALPAASAVLNTAFDPQNALYGRTLQQTQDQIGTYLARSGLTDSGAGGKIAADALNNFNIDWQNNQLGRQTQGLSSFNSGVGGAANNLTSGNALQTGGAGSVYAGGALPEQAFSGQTADMLSQLGQYGGGLTTGSNLTAGGLGLQGTGNTYASDTYSNLLAPQYQALTGFGTAAGQMGNLLGQSTNIGTAGINNLNTGINGFAANAAQAPYNASQTVGANQLGGLSSFLGNAQGSGNLGSQNISQMLNYIQQIMQGSQNAANATKSVAGTTTSQNAGAAAGLSPFIQSGLNGLSSLFSGSGGSSDPFAVGTPAYGSYNMTGGY